MPRHRAKKSRRRRAPDLSTLSPFTRIHNDILREILTLLPFKSIMWCVCVSKQWKAMIKDPSLIKFCNTIHANELSRNTLIFENAGDLVSVNLNNLKGGWRFHIFTEMCKSHKTDILSLVGSCNGLLCYRSYISDHVAISDHLTQTWKLVPYVAPYVDPAPSSDGSISLVVNFGFGYDSSTDDYKVMRISYDWVVEDTC